ncbi:hypothetical protein FRC02_003772 [Tulasnella sp. 418]|nr:hypothetical protein FRC02_003772 [Tulasnella sp. 418]
MTDLDGSFRAVDTGKTAPKLGEGGVARFVQWVPGSDMPGSWLASKTKNSNLVEGGSGSSSPTAPSPVCETQE